MPIPSSVSVVICTFNRKEWLERCLEGLNALELPPTEVIVVDGPSSDGTRELLEALQAQERLILVAQPRLEGISAARNMGLAAAHGEVVCFIDDDAVPYPGWTTAILSAYDRDDVGGVGGPVDYMSGELALGRNAVSIYGDWADESKGQSLEGRYPLMIGCNMSFRTEVLRRVGGFDPFFRYHQDETDACLRVLRAGYEIRYVEGAKVRHEWCEGSYRRDRLRWYLKFMYLCGRNNSYLVSKNFRDRVSFGSFLAHHASLMVGRRTAALTSSPGERSEAEVPRSLRMMGAVFELCGSFSGWK